MLTNSDRSSVCLYLKECILFGVAAPWFLPRDAMSQRHRLSVTLVDCIHTAEDIVKLLARSGSPITVV